MCFNLNSGCDFGFRTGCRIFFCCVCCIGFVIGRGIVLLIDCMEGVLPLRLLSSL